MCSPRSSSDYSYALDDASNLLSLLVVGSRTTSPSDSVLSFSGAAIGMSVTCYALRFSVAADSFFAASPSFLIAD